MRDNAFGGLKKLLESRKGCSSQQYFIIASMFYIYLSRLKVGMAPRVVLYWIWMLEAGKNKILNINTIDMRSSTLIVTIDCKYASTSF